jgi:hypothetical protein
MDAKIHPHRGASDQSRLMDAMCINTIRTLSMDAVQAANSGHPGCVTQNPAGNIRAGFRVEGRITARVKQAGRDRQGDEEGYND